MECDNQVEDECVKETEGNDKNIPESHKMEDMTHFKKQNSASVVIEITEMEANVEEVQESGIKQVKLSMLKNEMSIKPCRRPKNRGVIWPSKSKVTCKKNPSQRKHSCHQESLT